jgi:hypothetical protein
VNPLTGKREMVDPEGEFIPGETIVKQGHEGKTLTINERKMER